jgi:type VI protein secretion system component VasF
MGPQSELLQFLRQSKQAEEPFLSSNVEASVEGDYLMHNIFWIIGVVVVVLILLSFFGLR